MIVRTEAAVEEPDDNSSIRPLELNYAGPISKSAERGLLKFSAAELLVSIVVAALLIVLLVPSIQSTNQTPGRVKCASNLKTIGQAMLLYANAHGGRYPDSFETLILAEEGTADWFICTSSDDEAPAYKTVTELAQKLQARGKPDAHAAATSRPWMHCSYIYCGAELTSRAPAETVLAFEPMSNHDSDGINILFGDGHTDFYAAPTAQKLIAELQAGHNPPRAEKLK